MPAVELYVTSAHTVAFSTNFRGEYSRERRACKQSMDGRRSKTARTGGDLDSCCHARFPWTPNVAAIMHAGPADIVHHLAAARQSSSEVVNSRRDLQDPP